MDKTTPAQADQRDLDVARIVIALGNVGSTNVKTLGAFALAEALHAQGVRRLSQPGDAPVYGDAPGESDEDTVTVTVTRKSLALAVTALGRTKDSQVAGSYVAYQELHDLFRNS